MCAHPQTPRPAHCAHHPQTQEVNTARTVHRKGEYISPSAIPRGLRGSRELCCERLALGHGPLIQRGLAIGSHTPLNSSKVVAKRNFTALSKQGEAGARTSST